MNQDQESYTAGLWRVILWLACIIGLLLLACSLASCESTTVSVTVDERGVVTSIIYKLPSGSGGIDPALFPSALRGR